MFEKNECLERLDRAIALIESMKSILASGEQDAPASFLETSHEAISRLNDAVAMALSPLLEEPSFERDLRPDTRR